MEISKIKELCLFQARYYYDYIQKYSQNNGKSIEKVQSISFQNGSFPFLFEIKLEKPIYDFEKTYYKNRLTNEYYFNKKDIFIKEFDEKNKLLYIQVLREDIDLKNLNSDDFLIVNDLLFLIENLILWYEKNALKLCFSSEKYSNIDPLINNLFDTKLNENQVDAVKAIFKNRYSYIWGPPGTGKTKAVLSSAVINYINHNKKVLIVAPTNVALEQILLGLLDNTMKLGINNKKILRIGIPSKDFYERFPEICEIKGLQKALESIENELKIIERVIKYRDGLEITIDLEKINILFDDFEINRNKIEEFEKKIEDLQPLINLLTKPLKHYHFLNNNKMIKEAIKKRNDCICINYDEKLIEENSLKEVINIECIRDEIKKYESNIKLLNQNNLSILTNTKKYLKSEKIHNEIFKDLNEENLKDKKIVIKNKISQLKLWCKTNLKVLKEKSKNLNDNLINKALDEHHKDFDNNELINKRDQLLNNKTSIIEQSTKQRVQNSQIIAMTIDAYIQYTLKEDIKVDHIFCDEAGYMSNIKALTLFKNSCSITFLGDHMQLPPVSEIRSDDRNAMEKSFLWSQSSLFFETLFLDENKESLYEKFLLNKEPSFKNVAQVNLKYTHRFGANLAKILDKFIYKFGFESARNEDTELIFINSNSNVQKATQRSSIEEAMIIKEIIKNIKENFAILTPYKSQVKLLKDILGKEYFENIMTIHKSQGSEYHTVIFSVVDDSFIGKRKMFFTDSLNENFKSLNLINTVVSRAKKRLIIIANEDFWIKQKNKQLIANMISISRIH